jgi:hypothetical protein
MVLLYFVIIFGISPFLYFLVAKRQCAIELKAILPYVFLTFISSLYELLGSLTLGWNVSYWFLVYDVLDFSCVFYFFYIILQKKYSRIFTAFLISFTALCYYLYLHYAINDFLVINNYFKGFITFFVLLFSILWFVKIFAEVYVDNLLNNSTFYFISGFILYYCGTLFLFLLSNYILEVDSSLFQSYWVVNIVLNFVLRSLLLVGLWKAKTN